MLAQIALDLVPELVLGLDARYTIRFVNQPARIMTGYGDDELIGAAFLDALVPEDLRPASHHQLEALVHGAADRLDDQASIRTRDGSVRDLARCLHRLPAPAEDGVVILVVGADVTDARRAAQREQRHDTLQAIGTLASGLAHEIRNPINAAQLHISFLRRLLAGPQADPEVLDTIAVVGDELQRLARLMSEFLAFAEPGELHKAPCVVQDIVARAVTAAAVPAGVAVVIQGPTEDLVVVADAGRLERVVRSLLDNALEALRPGDVGEIAVRARRGSRSVILEVEDDGPGLPSPAAPVFDAFFSTKSTGLGLGLAVSHRIVTDHGGAIDVESRPGRTCFRVALPVEDAPRTGRAARA